MIEEALRKRLQPIVNRRRHLYLAWRLSVYWFILGLAGLALLGADWYWGWSSSLSVGALCVAAVLITLLTAYRSQRIQPDYKAVARNIEQQHPELRALLLAAVEQEPQNPDGELGYLQEKVIGEALLHANCHDWVRSVPAKRLVWANVVRFAVLLFLSAIVVQLAASAFPSRSRSGRSAKAPKGYNITVSPGDATVESGSPVVVLARFDGRMPLEATLLLNESDGGQARIPLTKNLDDPVFGGIIEQVSSETIYRIEYAGKVTRDYRISTFEHPSLEEVDAHIVYPSYTNLPEKLVKDTRQLSVAEGSQITLTFTLNKPVATASLTSKEKPALDLTVDSEYPNVYTAAIIPTEDQRYELHLVDAQGHANKMPPRFTIDVHKNMPAELRPTFPNRDVAVSPLEELSLEAEVSDDFGLTGYGVSYTVAGTQSSEIILSEPGLLTGKQQIQHLLALEELKVQPDQLLTYYFWADDVGPDGRPRRAYSDMYFAEVRHFEEIFRESQSFQDQSEQNQREQQQQSGEQSQDQQAEQLVRLQKQIISATWNIKQQADRSGGLDDKKDDLDVVGQSQADAIDKAQTALNEAEDPPAMKALQEASRHMETSLDHLNKASESLSSDELNPALGAEQAAYQELLKLRQREHEVAQARSNSSSSSSSQNSARFEQQLQQLEMTERENRYETESLAQDRQQQTQSEDLQVLNRLEDLARRQNEMSERLREAEAALRQAQNEEQRQQALRELKRLRDQQLEALEDVDELQQRMERPQNRSRMADAREQLDESRSRIRQSAEELEQGMVSRAVTSATRAQRQLEQMREEFQRNTSSRFTEQMRDMRESARQLDERQREIAEQIDEQVEAKQKTLADSGVNSELAEQTDQQRKSVEELIERMKDVSDQAESAEPLLSRTLYDTLRTTSTENVDRALEVTSELLRRNFLPQARDIERRAGEGIEQLREGVEQAAESVLGDEAEALRLAQRELDDLIREVDQESARAGARGQGRGDPNASAEFDPNQPQLASAQSGQRNQQQQQQGRQPGESQQGQQPGESQQGQQANESQQGQASANASGDRGTPTDQANETGQQQGQGRDGNPQANDRRTAGTNLGGQNDPTGWGGGGRTSDQLDDAIRRGPLTGEDYRQWADRLRDVQDMLPESELRRDLATVRDRAQAIRAEFKRHGTEPQWDLVEQQITKPLTELYKRLSNELARLQSDEAMVPIDRDPVPGRFTDLVREYFESLGGGQ